MLDVFYLCCQPCRYKWCFDVLTTVKTICILMFFDNKIVIKKLFIYIIIYINYYYLYIISIIIFFKIVYHVIHIKIENMLVKICLLHL